MAACVKVVIPEGTRNSSLRSTTSDQSNKTEERKVIREQTLLSGTLSEWWLFFGSNTDNTHCASNGDTAYRKHLKERNDVEIKDNIKESKCR